MKPIIYIKYGELTLKGKNRAQFIKVLVHNIKQMLLEYHELVYQVGYDNLKIINLEKYNLQQVINDLQQVYGIAFICVAYQVNKEINEIQLACNKLVNNTDQTFKIEARRNDKSFIYDSMQIKQICATYLLQNQPTLKVDVHHPQLLINIEIKHDCAIVYGHKIPGAKGLPVGINGKALVLLSGGIDSPVASRLIMKRGISVDFITFITPPHTSQKALDKTIALAKQITLNNHLTKANLYVCNFTKLQEEIAHISKESYRITLMRRYFMRIAKRLAIDIKAGALVTGEALGQVASQTLNSMQTISSVLNDFLVLRPLITYDKQEIISLAKQFNTYELSILPYDDSCSLFAPKNPTNNPNVQTAMKLEQESLVLDAIYELVFTKEITKINLSSK